MKKFLLSIVALAATFTASAQFSTDPAQLKIAAGETKDVVFSLKTDAAPVAFQLYIQCPDGIDVATFMNEDDEEQIAIVAEGSRFKSHHSITALPVAGVPGKYMIGCASSKGSAEAATLKNNADGQADGAVLKVTFKATSDIVDGAIQITESLAGFVGGTDVKFPDFTIDINPTAIEAISADQTKSGVIYNIAGQRVNKATKGIFIIDGKKYVAGK